MRVASIQVESDLFNLTANLSRADDYLKKAAAQGAALAVLPELFNTGYAYDQALLRNGEPIGGVTTAWMQSSSRKYGLAIAGALVERARDGFYDTLVFTHPNGTVETYRKRYPAFFEHLYFRRGTRIGLFSTPLGRIGVMICWDIVHHARLTRELAGKIDLLLVCSAWPDMTTSNFPLPIINGWMSRRPSHCLGRIARALEVPVIYSNMTGRFQTRLPGLGMNYHCDFLGSSRIIDSSGSMVQSLDLQEGVAVSTLDSIPVPAGPCAA